jgi:transposase-like protein
MTADLTNPIFTNDDKARAHLESLLWPNGPVCPHCKESAPDALHKLEGKSHRPGLYQCNSCRGHFTVTVGTVFERSKIALHKWVLAFHLMAASKKGMSAHQLHRMLGVTYKTAWFMAHRIREAMRGSRKGVMGGDGGVVAVDETYYGNSSKRAKGYRKGHRHKQGVVGLVDPATGEARAFHVKPATSKSIRAILVRNASRKSALVTDESYLYHSIGPEFAMHQTVFHGRREYVNSDGFTTNNVENFFGTFKRGMRGTYHFCGEQHLQRYLNEFSFRYTNRFVTDKERAALAVTGAEGKRLTYRQAD